MTIEQLKEMTIEQLKALAYDQLVTLDATQKNLSVLNQIIAEKSNTPVNENK